MDSGQDDRPSGVEPVGAPKQGGEARFRWDWVEPVVWTDRMLAALEKGVKGGVWYSLMDKVYSPRTLERAWEQVRRNKGRGGVDHETVEQFSRQSDRWLRELSESLRSGTYTPKPVRRVYIPKADGRKRPLGIPAVRDRIVQTALRKVMEPIFEVEFCEGSYGFRPHRGPKDALRRVDGLLKAGYTHVVDADLKSYFDSIPWTPLMDLIRQRIADSRVLSLVEAYLEQGVMEGMEEWTPIHGTPQGAVMSPLLSNLYLHPLDVRMRDAGYEMVRYADDFVVLCRMAEEAEGALKRIQQWVQEAGLALHPEKTRVVNMDEPGGFDFLGYHFEGGRRVPRRSSLRKFKEVIRRKTRRTNGWDLGTIIRKVNLTVRGWFAYFQHSHWSVFQSLDGWIRMRLRSVLRKRQGLRGRGRGRDHQRWPNTFFRAQGLFIMREAHARMCQSLGVH